MTSFRTLAKVAINRAFRRHHKTAFLHSVAPGSRILDVGCGNNSAFHTKNIVKNCFYVGIDITNYNNQSIELADEYVLVDKQKFADGIREISSVFDVVVSSHNIEHCDQPFAVLSAMIDKLDFGGKIYLSFPCEESIKFPKRDGTLNYFDDPTHNSAPPSFDKIIFFLESHNLKIQIARRRYRPLFFVLMGLILEPVSFIRRKVLRGTWELYGFESIIIAEKREFDQ